MNSLKIQKSLQNHSKEGIKNMDFVKSPTDIRAGGFGPLFGLSLAFAFIYAYRSNFFLKLNLNKQFLFFL